MNRFERYVVKGTKRLNEHGYSCQLGAAKALDYAISCADHPSMFGTVFGEAKDGSRTVVYACKAPISKQPE